MKHFGDIELIEGEIINLIAKKVAADPVFDAADVGIIIYNTTENSYKYNNGSAYVTFEVSLTSSTQLVETLGDNWINPDLSFNPTDFNNLDNIDGLTANDNLFTALAALDTAITEAKTVTTLQGVSLNFTPGSLTALNILLFDGTDFIPGTVNDLDPIELNFSELQDTTIINPENDNFAVFDNGGWVNKPIFFKFEELSGTLSVFTVNHSLDEQFCIVSVIDMSFATPRRIDPAEIVTIEYNTESTLTVTLTGNKPVTIIVASVAFAVTV